MALPDREKVEGEVSASSGSAWEASMAGTGNQPAGFGGVATGATDGNFGQIPELGTTTTPGLDHGGKLSTESPQSTPEELARWASEGDGDGSQNVTTDSGEGFPRHAAGGTPSGNTEPTHRYPTRASSPRFAGQMLDPTSSTRDTRVVPQTDRLFPDLTEKPITEAKESSTETSVGKFSYKTEFAF